jgi:hypothetical protein
MTEENPDYSELLENIKSPADGSRPTYDPIISALELASRVAAKYRETGKGKATVVSRENGEVLVGLELDPLFARNLIEIYELHRAGLFIRRT